MGRGRVGRTAVVVGCASALIVAALSRQRVVEVVAVSMVVVTLAICLAIAVRRANRRIEADLDELRRVGEESASDEHPRYGT